MSNICQNIMINKRVTVLPSQNSQPMREETPLPQKCKHTSESTVSYDKDYKRNAQWNIIWKCPEARKSLACLRNQTQRSMVGA